MLVIHTIMLTMVNHLNWLEFHLPILPCGVSVVACNFFLRHSWLLFMGCPGVGKYSSKRILSFSVPRGSRVFSSSFPSLGSIFQSDNLHLTLHPQGIGFRFTFLTGDFFFFHIHIPDPKLICPITSWTVPLERVTGFSNSTSKKTEALWKPWWSSG